MNLIGKLRHWVPNKYKDAFVSLCARFARVDYHSALTNVFHCCVYKTGSQWIRRLLSDPRTYRRHGLRPINGAQIGTDEERWSPIYQRRANQGFPPRTAVTGLFISYEGFQSIPKPEEYAAFFVKRDPRELTVSWYLSTRYTHPPNPEVSRLRDEMRHLSDKEGILYSIDYWHRMKLFDILRNWQNAQGASKKIKVFSFEDLTGQNGLCNIKKLFRHLDIRMPPEKIQAVWRAHDVHNISRGEGGKYSFATKKGTKRNRKKWPQYFDSDIENHFRDRVPHLVEQLGYRW